MNNAASFVGVAGVIIGLLCLTSALAQGTAADADGFWVNRNGWIIETAACDEGICGRVVGMRERAERAQRLDIHNPDENLRQRTICGMEIFGAFEPSGTRGEWHNGWIYNPQDGKTYSSTMKLGDGDTLEVRGFVLTPMFGRTIVMTRASEPVERCNTRESTASLGAGDR